MTPTPTPIDEIATHAGGVVYRRDANGLLFMLVSAKSAPTERVLPKGHIDAGETAEVCALREVREESGALTHIVEDLGYLRLIVKRRKILVHMFLMEAFGTTKHAEPWRVVEWLPTERALLRATHDETRRMISTARDILRRPDSNFR